MNISPSHCSGQILEVLKVPAYTTSAPLDRKFNSNVFGEEDTGEHGEREAGIDSPRPARSIETKNNIVDVNSIIRTADEA